MGAKLNTITQIDNLVYNYMLNSNKLLNVIDDAKNDPVSKLGDFRQSPLYQQTTPTKTAGTIDYTYDPNGNLVQDYNKDIIDANGNAGITYNYLNLPPWMVSHHPQASRVLQQQVSSISQLPLAQE
ncbi:MAG: hypothetical protein H7320_08130 [Ferruginibacter sp.]|nr:hypothetical protein [Ferruginibacter sp.]